jgi:hypothetical protein
LSGLALLDVAIAMVFFFLLLSLVSSAANEIIAALLQTRARFLERGIKRLLTSDAFASMLYNHPLIKSLSDEVDPWFKKVHKAVPSYIPSKTFALAMMDLMSRNPGGIVPAEVYDAVEAMLAGAERDAATVRQSLEDWYNNAMERVSGGYKRRTQYVLFVLGIIAAIAVNGDSVAVIERLSTSKTLSGAVSAAAIQFAQSPNGEHAGADHPSSAQQSLQDTLVTLDKLGLPIGWTGPGDDNTFLLKNKNEQIPAAALRLLEVHWVGWLITGLAVSFGAPFWFDLLSRFITVRSTIKPQDKTKT